MIDFLSFLTPMNLYIRKIFQLFQETNILIMPRTYKKVANEIVTKFTDNRPGHDCARNFLKCYNFTLKKGGQMQLARKSVTSNPFVIYGYYEQLEEVVKQLGIEDRPECIYNLDETGFPNDPTKVKSIGTKGAKTVRLTHGANRGNITVLATCCADGSCLDPLIVFKGKRMQSTWVGENALMETQYAVSDSGLMTSSIFEDFFISFIVSPLRRSSMKSSSMISCTKLVHESPFERQHL